MIGKEIEIGRRDFVRHSVGMGAGVAALGHLPRVVTRPGQNAARQNQHDTAGPGSYCRASKHCTLQVTNHTIPYGTLTSRKFSFRGSLLLNDTMPARTAVPYPGTVPCRIL